MEIVARFRVPNGDVWFVQAVLTDREGQAVVSLGEREADESVMSVFYDDSAKGELAPLFAYLTAVGKIMPVSHDKP
ncbi:hypothetical protein [Candidatus Cryosericum septentrionale]|jgi:hypothetical protein|uniref:Uncharacterized protein n=1 Tax=Candidatus Cryosericum septentrionale TaxID=2290913 RepID=A0A398DY17_9BACT|nr:hypothetical protein [Candidatus Cryosericum septentrionale]RIE16224.1 hypothetical protein SMC1_07895 [Candidatus Cryosericum septentrionale]